MNVFEFALGIVIIGCIYGLIKHYLLARTRRPADEPDYRSKLEELEKRLRTLEAIVTDRGYDLKREFEKL